MVKFLLAVILVELLTELLVKSVIFQPIRNKIKNINGWFKELLSCGYCTSVWVAFAITLLVNVSYSFTGIFPVDLGLTALVLHRLSNVMHNVIDKWTDKYYSLSHLNTDKS